MGAISLLGGVMVNNPTNLSTTSEVKVGRYGPRRSTKAQARGYSQEFWVPKQHAISFLMSSPCWALNIKDCFLVL